MENIKIKVSPVAYKEKPTVEDMYKMTYEFHKDYTTQNLNYKEISELIKSGHSCIFAEFKSGCGDIKEENINSISCIALDVDSKDKPITIFEMITIIYKKLGVYPIIDYCTFSDTDYTRFRLVYRLENKIDKDTYKVLYKALQWKFKQLDTQTSNANRIWAGTNKDVNYRENDKPFTFALMCKLINNYTNMLKRKENKTAIIQKIQYKEIEQDCYIKTEYKKEVADYLTKNINLKDFIERHFGGNFKLNGSNYVGCCTLHGGDNKSALVISKEIYTCFTNCGTGNVITLAKKVYNENNFSNVCLRLAKEYSLGIPSEYLVEVK